MKAKSTAKISLIVLVVWAILCAVWNVYGSVQIANGGQPLGPTASLLGGVLSLALAVLLVVSFLKWPSAYRWLTIVPIALAGMTIWNAFRLDPVLWPSEFWRWAGIAVNSLGVGGGMLAVLAPRRT